MKVGVIVDNEYYSDVRVKREVRLLKEFGYEVCVLCIAFSRSYDYQEEGVEIIPIHLTKKVKKILYFMMNTIPFYEWWWKKRVLGFIKDFKPDIIHTHDLYMSKSVKKGIEASGHKIPMILDLHENYPHAIQSYSWTQGFLRSLLANPGKWLLKEREYLAFADRIIVLSEDFRQSLLSRYSFLKKENVMVFPNVVDTQLFDSFRVSDKINDTLPPRPRVLYFGMVASRRGIFRSLKAVEELLEKGANLSLLIIGPVDSGDKVKFNQEIGKTIFKNHLVYIPWIDISELPSYLAASDIALAPFDKNPQHESGIANKIFQYMYGKLPILASNCKPQQELIEKYQIGEVFSTDEELVEKLSLLLQNDSMRTKMGEKAHHVLMTEFHQNTFMPRLKALYDELGSDSNA